MKYEEARNEANRLVRKAKYEYERSIAINMKEDGKIFWKFIQSKTKTKENSPCIIDDFAFLTKRLASFLASSYFILLLLINLVYSL
jgi:hypothetical protein